MNERKPTPAESEFGELSRALQTLPRPEPEARFRSQLRERILTEAREEDPPSPEPIPLRAPFLRPRSALIVAAALLLLITPLFLFQREDWHVLGSEGDGIVIIDGVPFAAAEPNRWAHRLEEGAILEVGENTSLTLANGRNCELLLTPGTSVAFPSAPGRWFDRVARLDVISGEVRATTGPTFKGSELVFRTAEAETIVTGTTLSVARNDRVSCVCVLEGRVSTRDLSSGVAYPVGAGRRLVVSGRALTPHASDISDMERMKLDMSRQAARERLYEPGP